MDACLLAGYLNCLFLQDSKRTFLHNMISEGGDKGKLECFINFCEDTIFEVSGIYNIFAKSANNILLISGL